MTDRELLELAAKATGFKWKWVTCPKYGATEVPGMHLVDGVNEVAYYPAWNPLADDGDALRLAVKLNLHDAIKLAHRLLGGEGCECMYAATRRAIVLAAAEIGRAMA